MIHHFVVEDEVVGERGEDEVEEDDAGCCEDGEREDLAGDVVTRPC